MSVSYGALFGALTATVAATALQCDPASIQSILPDNASVNFAYSVSANSTLQVPKGNLGYPVNPVGLPALCAVSVQVQSVGDTTFGLGLFLPADWNERFLAVGNGGYAGGINWLDMGPGVRYGFATMSTDTGHNSTAFDGAWAYNEPGKVENWGHLALHGSVVVAKIITTAYYGKDISYNYYAGCSTGGRQGMKEAEMYPDDFDGIMAGAPAWWTSHLQAWTLQFYLYNLPNTTHHIPPALFPIIGKEVVKQCDPQDGVKDGIVSDPNGCNFRPEEILCGPDVKNQTAAACLTPEQLTTLDKIYNDMSGANNTLLYPSLNPGTESQWSFYLNASAPPSALGTDYIRGFLKFGREWSYLDFNESIQHLADRVDPGRATVRYDLSAFHAKGGKLLSYHGMNDAVIPMNSLPYYYDQLVRLFKPQGIDVSSFFRFFLVPGMQHCYLTDVDAPWYFAGASQAPRLGPTVYSTPGFNDRQHDAMLALMAWVEQGVPPEKIIATRWTNDTLHDEVKKQRPLCMYPKKAVYVGCGDVDDAKNWKCEALF